VGDRWARVREKRGREKKGREVGVIKKNRKAEDKQQSWTNNRLLASSQGMF